ncbi:hypothetical protein RYX36_016641 [Vicia faba]
MLFDEELVEELFLSEFHEVVMVFKEGEMNLLDMITGQFNAITAQDRTDPNQNTRTSIYNSTIKVIDDLAPNITTVKTSLGRPVERVFKDGLYAMFEILRVDYKRSQNFFNARFTKNSYHHSLLYQTLVNNISSTISNDAKIHSVSLTLFLKDWVGDNKKQTSSSHNGRNLGFRNGRLPLNISDKVRACYDLARRYGRKLLQTIDESVVVSNIVIVDQNGSGYFTTINDAINVAPNNSVASSGYFFIYVAKDVYQEYVSIYIKKKYLMMVGDKINRMVITGDHNVHNVVDDFTTF